MNIGKLSTWALASVALYGGYLWGTSGKNSDHKEAATLSIQHSFNGLGESMKLTPEEVLAILEGGVSKKEDLKRALVKITRPDGVGHTGKLSFDHDELVLPAETFAAVPVAYAREEEAEPFKDFADLQMTIRAVDLDRPDQGWFAIASELTERRLKVEIAEDIAPSSVPVGKYLHAKATVLYKVEKNGEKTPKRVLLKQLLP